MKTSSNIIIFPTVESKGTTIPCPRPPAHTCSLLTLLEACKHHLGAGNELLGSFEVSEECVLGPRDALVLIGGGVAEPDCLTRLAAKQAVEVGASLVLATLSMYKEGQVNYSIIHVGHIVSMWKFSKRVYNVDGEEEGHSHSDPSHPWILAHPKL